MPIKALYCCDFCDNETVSPNENWHRLAAAKPVKEAGMTFTGEIMILCNTCKDHLLHKSNKK